MKLGKLRGAVGWRDVSVTHRVLESQEERASPSCTAPVESPAPPALSRVFAEEQRVPPGPAFRMG